ncbi:scabin-related ADP-ribosyltransferase [Streptomyces sp. NPDC054796]
MNQRSGYPNKPTGFTEVIQENGTWRLLTDNSSESYAAQFRDGSLVGFYDQAGPRTGKITDYAGNQFSLGEIPAWNWYDQSGRQVGASIGAFDSLPETEWGTNFTTTPEYWRGVAHESGIHLSRIHPTPVWAPTDGVELWRNSRHSPPKVFAEGFLTKGRETPNLLSFVYDSPKNTTYISLTTVENYVQRTAMQSQVPVSSMKDRWAYNIDLPHGAINVNATLDIASAFPDQREYIAPGRIPSRYIKYAQEIDLRTGALKAKRYYNPHYSPEGSFTVAQRLAVGPSYSQSRSAGSAGSAQGPSVSAAAHGRYGSGQQRGRRP